MLRVTVKWLGMSFLLLALVGTAVAAPAGQAGALLAAVVSFTSDVSTVNYADVEAGTALTTLSWRTINTNGQYRLALDTYQQNRWVSLLGANEALPLNGERQITVTHPQNYGVPTYRLTLQTTRGDVIGQQFITIPYAPSAQAAPHIVSFSTQAPSIDTNLLVQNNARLNVNWQIADRSPNTLIRFEQVLPDGSTISVEPSRSVLWLPSEGQGGIVPRSTASKEDLHFRMSLINLDDNSVIDQAEFSLPVIGTVIQAPQLVQQPSNPISVFNAEPGASSVTLNWDAGDAQRVEVLQQVANEGPTTLYIQLPPSGSITVPIPADAPETTFTLRAQTAEGEVSTGAVTVPSTGP